VGIERLQAEHGVAVRWRGFPLHPEISEEGIRLERLFDADSDQVAAMVARLKQVAAELDLPFGDRTMSFNSRLAQELAKWAESRGHGEAFHRAAFRAYFAQGRNLADRRVLCDMAREAGLDPDEAGAVIRERRFRRDVDRDWKLAAEMGVTVIPTFIYGKNRITGAQAYEAMVELVTDGSRLL